LSTRPMIPTAALTIVQRAQIAARADSHTPISTDDISLGGASQVPSISSTGTLFMTGHCKAVAAHSEPVV
jgi:hypothetical protein